MASSSPAILPITNPQPSTAATTTTTDSIQSSGPLRLPCFYKSYQRYRPQRPRQPPPLV
ncbi:unnamed protein product [Coffea canephora]|uniref:Uncharacterized protein n=1 Tax=Coffea canephora TaxID=49390 RepID=A0A068V8K0_COFCA|nr:unnamed protein product [Coffea canephora]